MFQLTEQNQCSLNNTLTILSYFQRHKKTVAASIVKTCNDGQSMKEHSRREIKWKRMT
jgi:hypothetical protein